jgi:Mg/Co/Ni transporter MgtE
VDELESKKNTIENFLERIKAYSSDLEELRYLTNTEIAGVVFEQNNSSGQKSIKSKKKKLKKVKTKLKVESKTDLDEEFIDSAIEKILLAEEGQKYEKFKSTLEYVLA